MDKSRIIPVVTLKTAEERTTVLNALKNCGIDKAEICYRTECAEEALRLAVKEFPEMEIGAGTVINLKQCEAAVSLGAKFIVSPGLNPKVVEYCLKKGYPITPGIMTPTELEVALGFGLDVVKIFPAENAGGLKMIKAMSAPYTMMKFMPTGGINATNVRDYLACDKILACGGSWMVKGDLVAAGRFDEIEKLTRVASGIVNEIRG